MRQKNAIIRVSWNTPALTCLRNDLWRSNPDTLPECSPSTYDAAPFFNYIGNRVYYVNLIPETGTPFHLWIIHQSRVRDNPAFFILLKIWYPPKPGGILHIGEFAKYFSARLPLMLDILR